MAAASTVRSKAMAVLAVLSIAAFSVVSAQEAPAPSPTAMSAAGGVAAPSLAAALVASGAAFLFAAVRH